MLIILSTHPIQYQAPLWRALARDGGFPFEVWFMSDHGLRRSEDREFGKSFAWDIDLLEGYKSRFLNGADKAVPASFWKCRLREGLKDQLVAVGAKQLWIQGWQVLGYWQAVREARAARAQVWLRGESNDLAAVPAWKGVLQRRRLGWLFSRVDRFLCIGAANRRLYESYGVAPERLYPAPYAVDSERFAAQAESLQPKRSDLRRQWEIPDDGFCVLFCGKFIPKKRPMDLVTAATMVARGGSPVPIHLLFVGSGELGPSLRAATTPVFDGTSLGASRAMAQVDRPAATFTGFLNQTEISRAYVAADCLVLPSDYGETWGLVANESLASGLPCIVSDSCGCAEDLKFPRSCEVFRCGDLTDLARRLVEIATWRAGRCDRQAPPPTLTTFETTVKTVRSLIRDQL